MVVGFDGDRTEQWCNWIVRVAGESRPIGAVQATVALDRPGVAVAWEIGVEWWGHGYASEAAVGLVDLLLARGIGPVRAFIHPDHAASARVAARAGLSPTNERVDGEVVWVSAGRA